jgi:Helix-turn-helix domain
MVAGMEFYSPRQAAKLLCVGHATIHRHCQQHDGFAQMVDGRWRIPTAHIDRVLEGETVAQVAKNPSHPEGNASSDTGTANAIRAHQGETERARRQLVQSYFSLLAARHHADEISATSHDRLLGTLAGNILEAMKDLGLIEAGGLRTAISECEAPAEFRALTGVRASY